MTCVALQNYFVAELGLELTFPISQSVFFLTHLCCSHFNYDRTSPKSKEVKGPNKDVSVTNIGVR